MDESHHVETFSETTTNENSQTKEEEELTNSILEDVKQKNSEIVEETAALRDDQPVPENDGNAEESPVSKDDKPLVGRRKKLLSEAVRDAQERVQQVVQDVMGSRNKVPQKGKTDEELIAEHFSDSDPAQTDEGDTASHDNTDKEVVSLDGFTDIDKSQSHAAFTDELEKTLDKQMRTENEAAEKLARTVASSNRNVEVESRADKSYLLNTEVSNDVSNQG